MPTWSDDDRADTPLALILGTNEIASAVAVRLVRAGFSALLSHDPSPPVIRRGMAFHDGLFGESVLLDGFSAAPVEDGYTLPSFVRGGPRVGVTRLGFTDLCPYARFDLLVDARMNKRAVKPDLRHLAGFAIGLGPGFSVADNCDLAIETRPARTGLVVTAGATDAPDGLSATLGGVGGERFVYAGQPGRWRTALQIGTRVYRGMIVGLLGREAAVAPMDGILRGLVRDDTEIAEPVKLIEIDPRNRWQAKWTGLDDRGRIIAEAVAAAVRVHRRPVQPIA